MLRITIKKDGNIIEEHYLPLQIVGWSFYNLDEKRKIWEKIEGDKPLAYYFAKEGYRYQVELHLISSDGSKVSYALYLYNKPTGLDKVVKENSECLERKGIFNVLIDVNTGQFRYDCNIYKNKKENNKYSI